MWKCPDVNGIDQDVFDGQPCRTICMPIGVAATKMAGWVEQTAAMPLNPQEEEGRRLMGISIPNRGEVLNHPCPKHKKNA